MRPLGPTAAAASTQQSHGLGALTPSRILVILVLAALVWGVQRYTSNRIGDAERRRKQREERDAERARTPDPPQRSGRRPGGTRRSGGATRPTGPEPTPSDNGASGDTTSGDEGGPGRG